MIDITREIGVAMKSRDQVKLSALRMLKTALTRKEVEKGRPLEPNEALDVVASQIKQRRDSIEQFSKAGRQDLVDKETAELAILQTYLPAAANAEEVGQAVDAAIAETGAAGPRDMGRVMKAVMAKLAGRGVDGKAVNELVRSRLSGPNQ